MMIMAPCSVGDLLDRITILEIKLRELPDGPARDNVERECVALWTARYDSGLQPSVAFAGRIEALRTVNQQLWSVEDELRVCEKAGRFDDAFVQLARSVYKYNDRRAAIKREINEVAGSEIVEEKLYGGSAR